MYENWVEKGRELRVRMFGKEDVEIADSASPFKREIEDEVTRFIGGIWSRDGVDLKTRSLVTLGILAALGRSGAFKMHVRGAINNGATQDEIKEVLLNVMVYAGLAAAETGFGDAAAVFDELQA